MAQGRSGARNFGIQKADFGGRKYKVCNHKIDCVCHGSPAIGQYDKDHENQTGHQLDNHRKQVQMNEVRRPIHPI